jgi:hypothetical protein
MLKVTVANPFTTATPPQVASKLHLPTTPLTVNVPQQAED